MSYKCLTHKKLRYGRPVVNYQEILTIAITVVIKHSSSDNGNVRSSTVLRDKKKWILRSWIARWKIINANELYLLSQSIFISLWCYNPIAMLYRYSQVKLSGHYGTFCHTIITNYIEKLNLFLNVRSVLWFPELNCISV